MSYVVSASTFALYHGVVKISTPICVRAIQSPALRRVDRSSGRSATAARGA
jgi:hypothetical protein